jgi:hypothetical protein
VGGHAGLRQYVARACDAVRLDLHRAGTVAETLDYQQTVEPLLRAAATLEMVTMVPVAQVADIVLGHVL